MDGGIRSGRGVLKAAALGAKGTTFRDRTAINTVSEGIQLPGTFEPAQRPMSTCMSVGSSEPMNDSTAAV
jgi:isopentenyl diphosphate isomerase/L-lactate dehydrogenase-like FMN-dependent dehydrogenase